MLRLPEFKHEAPETIDAALALLADNPGRARLVAGGTDLLPNMKHGIEEADIVVSLRNLPGLSSLEETSDGGVSIGAMITLEALTSHRVVRARYPALAQAAGLVAGPHHRRMGTLGGNVCLNTRCVYINQTHFWRESLGYCIKKDGEVCHVVKGGKRCVAAASNDTAPVLMTLGARLVLSSRDRGERVVAIDDFFQRDGVHNKVLEPDEMLVRVELPAPASGLHGAYTKLRVRDSIDFPRLSVAVAFALRDGAIADLSVVVSALAAVPQRMRNVGELAEGRVPEEALFDEIGAACFSQCHPLSNIDGDATYRREMVPVFVKRALRAAIGQSST